MDKFITSYGSYTVWQLSNANLYQLAEFVVSKNYKHHTNGLVSTDFQIEVNAIHRQEENYFNRSRVLVAKNIENKIIRAIRLMHWDGKMTLPIQTIFGVQVADILLTDSFTEVWHIGRFAVSTDIERYGITLFKLLLLHTMFPICHSKKRNCICRV